ncbi:20S proteasome subunit alpha 2 [Pancytospora epiphaga]|nr:20S proteasome subunit alpha 2 [Pancytospora epiphaga]
MFLNPDESLTLFSSKGNLEHCDNALTSALNGALSLGCAAQDGCVLMSFKNVTRLVVKESYHKVFNICPSIGVTYSGLQPDFRAQLTIAQRICQEYYDVYERFPYLDVFITEFSLVVQEHTQKGGYRPFGTFLIFAGQSSTGPTCYQLDPSGSFRQVPVVATGVGYDDASKFITRRLGKIDDNIVNCFLALREFTGKEVGVDDVSVGVFDINTQLFKTYDQEAIKEIFDANLE